MVYNYLQTIIEVTLFVWRKSELETSGKRDISHQKYPFIPLQVFYLTTKIKSAIEETPRSLNLLKNAVLAFLLQTKTYIFVNTRYKGF